MFGLDGAQTAHRRSPPAPTGAPQHRQLRERVRRTAGPSLPSIDSGSPTTTTLGLGLVRQGAGGGGGPTPSPRPRSTVSSGTARRPSESDTATPMRLTPRSTPRARTVRSAHQSGSHQLERLVQPLGEPAARHGQIRRALPPPPPTSFAASAISSAACSPLSGVRPRQERHPCPRGRTPARLHASPGGPDSATARSRDLLAALDSTLATHDPVVRGRSQLLRAASRESASQFLDLGRKELQLPQTASTAPRSGPRWHTEASGDLRRAATPGRAAARAPRCRSPPRCDARWTRSTPPRRP